MPKPTKYPFNKRRQSSWRAYQTDLQRGANARHLWRRVIFRTAAGALLALAAFVGLHAAIGKEGEGLRAVMARSAAPASSAPELASKQHLRERLDETAFNNLVEKTVELPVDEQVLQVETTLDTDLQSYLLQKLDRKHARYVGIVVMEAATGRLLAMAGLDKTDPAGNPCLESHFPAASIFKIVTAASAVDQCGYSADSQLHFNGYKHTLYKRQLTEVINRHTNTLSLQEAFAESVNPVFGKIGKLKLGKPLLEQSADAFGFNEMLDFDLPSAPSQFKVGDEPYQWAEVASGFNRVTTISPLHGAMMASAVLNEGRMVTPSLVDRIVDPDGRLLYRWQSPREQQAMSAEAATMLARMMEATVTSGTARAAFRNSSRDKVLSRLLIGGKTGSIGSASGDLRYDWFVGFARERAGQGQVVVSVLVAHEEFIGTRAGEYARMAISRFFQNSWERSGTHL